jgi:hypothetical protein
MLKRFVYGLRELGLDLPKIIKVPKGIFRYWKDFINFRKLKPPGRINISPAIQDFYATAGSADGHYFWQDLICAQWIYKGLGNKHLDVGSRVDGFIAHVLCFQEVDYLDIRPMSVVIPNLNFIQGDAQSKLASLAEKYDSVSSLHALEHFGLGRYSDSLDATGHIKGLANIANCVKIGGSLFVSYPVGNNVTEFNSQRLLHPNWAVEILGAQFNLEKNALIPWRGNPEFDVDLNKLNVDSPGFAVLLHLKRIF